MRDDDYSPAVKGLLLSTVGDSVAEW